jgi:hypothetical protein
MGHEVVQVVWNESLPPDLDSVLIKGPVVTLSIWPVVNQMLTMPKRDRPVLIYWFLEGFPNPNIPEWIVKPIAMSCAWLRRKFDDAGLGEVFPFALPRRRMTRFRCYGDLLWLRHYGVLDIFAYSSSAAIPGLEQRGFSPVVAYSGSHPSWGSDLHLERDISVLWMGNPRTQWRRQILNRIRQDLRSRGLEMLWIDNVENPFVYGEARTQLLNRTKVIVNIPSMPWDDPSMRPIMASLNGVLTVCLQNCPHSPFIAGEHVVEASPERMADTICYYLDHEDERRRIVQAAHQLVMNEITMQREMERLMSRVVQIRDQRMARGH